MSQPAAPRRRTGNAGDAAALPPAPLYILGGAAVLLACTLIAAYALGGITMDNVVRVQSQPTTWMVDVLVLCAAVGGSILHGRMALARDSQSRLRSEFDAVSAMVLGLQNENKSLRRDLTAAKTASEPAPPVGGEPHAEAERNESPAEPREPAESTSGEPEAGAPADGEPEHAATTEDSTPPASEGPDTNGETPPPADAGAVSEAAEGDKSESDTAEHEAAGDEAAGWHAPRREAHQDTEPPAEPLADEAASPPPPAPDHPTAPAETAGAEAPATGDVADQIAQQGRAIEALRMALQVQRTELERLRERLAAAHAASPSTEPAPEAGEQAPVPPPQPAPWRWGAGD